MACHNKRLWFWPCVGCYLPSILFTLTFSFFFSVAAKRFVLFKFNKKKVRPFWDKNKPGQNKTHYMHCGFQPCNPYGLLRDRATCMVEGIILQAITFFFIYIIIFVLGNLSPLNCCISLFGQNFTLKFLL